MTVPSLSYLVCALPRSGSSVVCDALSATELAGHPREYFQPEAIPKWQKSQGLPLGIPAHEYLAALVREKSTPNGVFGAKIMRSHFDGWIESLRAVDGADAGVPILELLARRLPGLRFVWVQRRDLLRQGISLLRATQTDLWHTRNPNQAAKAEPRFDFQALDAKVRLLVRQEAEWREFFQETGISPVEIVYEQFDADMARSVRTVLDALGIAVPAGRELFQRPLSLNRQSDALNDEWAARYRQLKGPC